ncbi:putative protein YyaP (plasmid) [Streptomyces sp. enrichment culture]|uniref:dihydrofolate reductase family protein n=1 Tax=Streptomyces sp. enrichment culture TaxID=1795815 RepID=UPI003F5485BE
MYKDAGTALLGRNTYQQRSAFFPHVTDERVPTADWMNSSPKYVVPSSLTGVGEWHNSHLITGDDIAGRIRALKQQPGGTLNAGGSITLIQWLMRNALLDELHLQMNPVIVGTGRALADGAQIPLALASTHTFPNGVIETHYTLQPR